MGSGGMHARHASHIGAGAEPEKRTEEAEPAHGHVAPPDAAANMVLRPLLDTHIPGVLWLRANVLYLQARQSVA